jgi:hypothetical protein
VQRYEQPVRQCVLSVPNALQAQQRAAHLQRIGQVGAALVNGVVPETAARQ